MHGSLSAINNFLVQLPKKNRGGLRLWGALFAKEEKDIGLEWK